MNKLAIFIDITDRSENIINKFKSENYIPSKVSWIEDVKEKCSGDYEKKVLIWHLSSSRIDDDLFSLPKLHEAINLLDSCQFTYKFGVTDNDESYRQQVRATGWFNAVESWAELKDRFLKNIDNGLEGKENFIKVTKEHLFHLFLPLDIDMQALAEIKDDKEKVRRYLHGDSEMDGMLQGKSNEHYRQKLYDLWHILNYDYSSIPNAKPSKEVKNLPKIEDSHPAYPCLRKLAGLDCNCNPINSPIYRFLKALDEGRWADIELTNKTDSLWKLFSDKGVTINDKGISPFHDWYCALADCLKD